MLIVIEMKRIQVFVETMKPTADRNEEVGPDLVILVSNNQTSMISITRRISYFLLLLSFLLPVLWAHKDTTGTTKPIKKSNVIACSFVSFIPDMVWIQWDVPSIGSSFFFSCRGE